MKAIIMSLAVLAGFSAHAETGDCFKKIAAFSEDFAAQNLDIVPDPQYTSVVISEDGKTAKVELTSSSGRNRQLLIKLGPGLCSIVSVQSL